MAKKQKLEEKAIKEEMVEEQTQELEDESMNLYMLIDMACLDGFMDIDSVYDFYDIVDKYNLRGFVGSLSECVEALNSALTLFRIENFVPIDGGIRFHVCNKCGGYYVTANY